MPFPRFDKLTDEQQAAILVAAREEFAARGYDGASLNRIIAASGVSKGAMYYYFADKADLFVTVAEHALDQVGGQIRAGLVRPQNASSFWTAVEACFELSFQALMARPDLAPLGRAVYGAPAEVRQAALARATAWIEQALRLGRELSAVRDDLPIGLLVEAVSGLVFAVDRWFAQHLEELAPDAAAEHGQALLRLGQDMLKPSQKNRAQRPIHSAPNAS